MLVRSDLNVPLDDGVITDAGRITASVPTLKALADAGVRQKLQELGFIAIGGTVAFYATSLAEETEKLRRVIRDSKIAPPA